MTKSKQLDNLMTRVQEVLDLANKEYNLNLNPIVKLDLKGKCTGRVTMYGSFKMTKIQLNIGALDVEGGYDHLMNNTIPHEVAHLVNYHLHPKERGHGKYWKSVAKRLGISNPSRCHSLDLKPARKVREWLYVLDCGTEIVLKTGRHNYLMSGGNYIYNKTKKLNSKHFVREIT